MAGSFAYKRRGLCFSPVHQESITYDLHKCEWVSQVSPSVFGVILLCSKIFYCALDAGKPPHLPAGWAGGCCPSLGPPSACTMEIVWRGDAAHPWGMVGVGA